LLHSSIPGVVFAKSGAAIFMSIDTMPPSIIGVIFMSPGGFGPSVGGWVHPTANKIARTVNVRRIVRSIPLVYRAAPV
jgi:hypothetical protein